MIFCCVVLSIAHLKSTHPLGKNNFPKTPPGDSVRHLEFVALLQLSHCVVGLCRWIDRLFSIFLVHLALKKKQLLAGSVAMSWG